MLRGGSCLWSLYVLVSHLLVLTLHFSLAAAAEWQCISERVHFLSVVTGYKNQHTFCFFVSFVYLTRSSSPLIYTFLPIEKDDYIQPQPPSLSISVTSDLTSCLCVGLLCNDITEAGWMKTEGEDI